MEPRARMKSWPFLFLPAAAIAAALIPEAARPRPTSATTRPEASAAEPASAARDQLQALLAARKHEHDGEKPCCNTGAATLALMERALSDEPGRALDTSPAGPRPDLARAVDGQLNIGYRDAAARDALLARPGLRLVRDLPALRVCTVAGAELKGDALSELPGLRFIEPDFIIRTAALPNDSFFPAQEGLQLGGIARAWERARGDGVIVAVLDTGVDANHPDLAGQLLPGYDFVNERAEPRDDNGHGTAISGIIAARADNQIGIAGVAPGARILPIKVADRDGQASVASVIAGLDLALTRGARIINISLGTTLPSATLREAIAAARQAGALIIAAAGNEAVHNAAYPAAWPEVLGVTVSDARGQLGFSGALAETVDLAAPGEEMPTTMPGGVYGYVSGSSASAAFASGVAALCLSAHPNNDAADADRALRSAARPIAALARARHLYRFGHLVAEDAVARAADRPIDLRLVAANTNILKPRPGQRCVITAEVQNSGFVATDGALIRLSSKSGAIIAEAAVPPLEPGASTLIPLPWTPSAAGSVLLTASLGRRGADESFQILEDGREAGNRLILALTATAQEAPALALRSRSFQGLDLERGQARFTAEVVNRGNAASAPARLRLLDHTKAAVEAAVPALAPGEAASLDLAWPVPSPAPREPAELRFELVGAAVDASRGQAFFDLSLGRDDALQTLYQQSNGVDIEHDAPREILASRPYLPLQIFVPSKGNAGRVSRLDVASLSVRMADNADGVGASQLYLDTDSAPASAPAGLVIVDELGQPQANLDIFEGQPLLENGRHNILRIPASALGLPAPTAGGAARFFDVELSWSYERRILFFFTRTRSGSHRKVLRVRFLSAPLPQLPGENHYYDVHHHTIAEWFFDNPINVVAPRKDYGGPIQMVREVVHGLGVTPTLNDTYGLVITTDHNAFYNNTINDPNGWRQRPPFGPVSIGAQPGTTEFEAYRNVFGPSAGEEVAFKQNIPFPQIQPIVNRLLDLLPGFPIGAHMLLYRHEHVEGPWHGGGFLGGPNIDIELDPLLDSAAANTGANSQSFAYCAHPFSGQGWKQEKLERNFGLDPALRTRDQIHPGSGKFVLKGLEFFNGASRRSLDKSKIDFRDLNPWADPDFANGREQWDNAVQAGLIRWHDFLSRNLEYAFVGDPDTRFIRKIYTAAGSDAHGAFNFSNSRQATPLNIRSTFSVDSSGFFDARTYVFGEGKPGANNYDRFMNAYADGNSVMTDGPVLSFNLDANTRWDSANARWHDASSAYENADGRMGGDGPLDGGRTMLVRRGSADVAFGYQAAEHPDYGANAGQITAIHIFKSEPGAPNPSARVAGRDELAPRGRLAPGANGALLNEPLDLGEEGAFTTLAAVSLGAFTGGDPAIAPIGPDERRCYTNPIWAATYDIAIDAAPDLNQGEIPAGALRLVLDADISLDPSSADFVIEALDGAGDSTGAPLGALVAASGTGFSFNGAVKDGRIELVNDAPISLGGDAYPAADRVSFVIYSATPLRDAAGNALNSIAFRFEAERVAPTSAASAASAAPAPSTAAAPAPPGSSGGSGGCDIGPRPADPSALIALAALLLALALLRRAA